MYHFNNAKIHICLLFAMTIKENIARLCLLLIFPCLYSVLVEDIPGWLGQLPIPLVVFPPELSQLVVNKDVVEVQLLLNLL